MSKVKCKVCSYSSKNQCTLKKVKINPNKPRTCDGFDYDVTKVRVKQKLKATYVPYYLTSRKAYKKHVEEEAEKQLAAEQPKLNISNPDILARFRSTVEE